jgi:hypothetical protein
VASDQGRLALGDERPMRRAAGAHLQLIGGRHAHRHEQPPRAATRRLVLVAAIVVGALIGVAASGGQSQAPSTHFMGASHLQALFRASPSRARRTAATSRPMAALAAAGLAIAGYLTWVHYAGVAPACPTSGCEPVQPVPAQPRPRHPEPRALPRRGVWSARSRSGSGLHPILLLRLAPVAVKPPLCSSGWLGAALGVRGWD